MSTPINVMDAATLKNLLAPTVYDSFEAVITASKLS